MFKRQLLVVVLSLGLINPLYATGFPTVDIAGLTQQITKYITQLQQYANELNMNATQLNQLRQMYDDYTQQIREYNHMLRQMRALQSSIQHGDALSAIQQSKYIYNNNPLVGNKPNDEDPALQTIVNANNAYYGQRLKEREIDNLINAGQYTPAVRAQLKAELQRVHSRDMLSVAQATKVDDLRNQLAALRVNRESARMELNNLGNEDLIASIQMLGQQSQLQLEMIENMIEAQQHMYEESNRMTNEIDRNRAIEFQWKQQRQPTTVTLQSINNFQHLTDL